MENLLNILEELLLIPSPTGHAEEALHYVENKLKEIGVKEYSYTNKGALLCRFPGKKQESATVFSAHVDTLGAMVKEIKANGRLKFSSVGGYDYHTVEGQEVLIESDRQTFTGTILIDTPSLHVSGEQLKNRERKQENMEIRVDEKTTSKQETENLGIAPGDFIFFKPSVEITPSGFIKSRHLDDKAAVAILMALAKELIVDPPKQDVYFFFSNYEEVGHGLATPLPPHARYLVAVDMAAVGEGQESREDLVTICAMDSTGPYDYELRKYFIALAKKHHIPYTVDIYPHYGSDASAALRAGSDVKAALIGPGVDASHNHERTHRDALQATYALCRAFSYQPMDKEPTK